MVPWGIKSVYFEFLIKNWKNQHLQIIGLT